jgi:hypothetical protein
MSDTTANGAHASEQPTTAQPAAPAASEGGPATEQSAAPPLEDRATSSPALPEQQPNTTEPDPTGSPETSDDPDEGDDDLMATLPQTLEEAHAEILRMRKWKQKKLLEYRNVRDARRTAEADATQLRTMHEQLTAKHERATAELATAKAEREAAETAKAAAEEVVERHRKAIVERFPEADREIAEQQPLDLLTPLYERLVGRPLYQQPPTPSSTRVPVASKPGAKPQPKSYGEYFGKR